MRHVAVPFLAAMLFTASAAHSQQIPASVADAEAEGAAFPRDPVPAVLPAAYQAGKFDGATERRCAEPVSHMLWPPSLRSGEIILRGYTGLEAGNEGNKMLWLPLHDPGQRMVPVSIRGVRLGRPSDTLRQTIGPTGVARAVHRHDGFGFPSTVRFPAAGQWLV